MIGAKGFVRLWLTSLLAISLACPVIRLAAQEPTRAPQGGEQTTPAANSPRANQEEKDENEQYKHSKMVATIGHMFGMSTETAATTFEVLNFAVLAVAIGGFLLKTLPKTFRDRSSAIQKELTDARSATEAASARLNSVEERLAKLDGQIAEMKTQAEKDAIVEEQRFRAAAEEERAKILASADQEIAAAAQAAQRNLQQYAASLAIEQATRRMVITAETDRLLVKGFTQRLLRDQKSTDTDNKGGEN